MGAADGGTVNTKNYVKMHDPPDLCIITTARKRDTGEWEEELAHFYDIYDSLRFIATTCEKMEDALNAIAEYFEKVTACLMDLIEGIKRQSLKMILQKLRPDYKDKCKIRWLDIPNKVMQGRIRRFC